MSWLSFKAKVGIERQATLTNMAASGVELGIAAFNFDTCRVTPSGQRTAADILQMTLTQVWKRTATIETDHASSLTRPVCA